MVVWKGDFVGGVGVMVKEELCEKVVEVRRVSGRVMTVVVFEEDVLRLICGCALQGGRSFEEKLSFYDELTGEWDMHSAGDIFICLGDFSGHIGRHIGCVVGRSDSGYSCLQCEPQHQYVVFFSKTLSTFRQSIQL